MRSQDTWLVGNIIEPEETCLAQKIWEVTHQLPLLCIANLVDKAYTRHHELVGPSFTYSDLYGLFDIPKHTLTNTHSMFRSQENCPLSAGDLTAKTITTTNLLSPKCQNTSFWGLGVCPFPTSPSEKIGFCMSKVPGKDADRLAWFAWLLLGRSIFPEKVRVVPEDKCALQDHQ